MAEPIILTEATIHLDAWAPPVEALAVSDGRIVAGGGLDAVTSRCPGAEVRRLGGATIVPGLVESHVHPIFFGLTQGWVDCRSPLNGDVADIQSRLRAALGEVPRGGWLRGWGYDDTLLDERRHLDRHDLDAVSEDVPIVVTHISGHFLGANTAALRIAGVDAASPEPSEGRIVRDADGQPTGLMWEMGAVALVLDAVPVPDEAALESAARSALDLAARRGMTTLHDLGIGLMAGIAELDVWRRLSASGDLPVRVFGYMRGDLATRRLNDEPDLFTSSGPGLFDLVGAKYWSDGSIQGLSAALLHPYSCADHTGDLLFDEDDLVDLMTAVDAHSGQCAVHANGDRAIATTIAALRRVRAAHPSGARHRIEHLQMAHPQHVRDLAALGGGASFFANHVRYWGDRHRDVFIGPQRAARIDPAADGVAYGLHFGLHSDCPITPMDSLLTMATAVTRRTSGGEVLGQEQALSPRQALHALTSDSAWLSGTESRSGTLQPGMDADLVVLDRDIVTGDPDDIGDTQVLATMVAGEFVYEA